MPADLESTLRGTDIVHKISESMKWHGIETVIYDQVESNPKDYNVMDSVKMYQENSCDSFVSIGGGSSHDACKGARISVAHDGRNVNEFEGFNQSENPKNPPHIAVSTTAGTGSETSWAYVITDTTTDPANPHKYVAFDDNSVTSLAIDDPVLYYDCPVDFTAQCGFDVLAHASEPYVSRLNFEPSLGNAIRAIELTNEHLREAVWNGQDLPGRQGMMYAQYIAAQAFNSGGLGIIHSISHAVSAFYDTHHAGGLQALRAHRPGHGRGHHAHDRRPGRGGRARRVHPPAARRGHPGEVHRRHPGLVLQEPPGQGPHQLLRGPEDHHG
ncbi:MAG: alcohol dehydrogenase [Actinomycetospora sp.]|nr:alcohol dehydrogenase [Actinomycetospora sp.]